MNVRKAETQFDFFSLMQIRCIVFMIEQHVSPTLEMDDEDKTCDHYIVEEDGNIMGTCRVLFHDDIWHIGRVAVLKEYRHKHCGSALLKAVEEVAKTKKIKALQLGSQVQAKAFYEKNGFKAYGDIYMDADIEHVMMEKTL